MTYVNSLEKMLTLMKMWMGILGFLAVMGIAKGGRGIGGWMGDENDFCMVMNMAVPFGYFLLFSATGVAQKMKYLGFLGTFILAAMASLSRGGFIGLAAVGALLLVPLAQEAECSHSGCCGGVVHAGACSRKVLGRNQPLQPAMRQWVRMGTGGERLYTWGIGMDMFFANPIIGIGQSNFPMDI